jgi:membrane protease YdiL (CAAX protease family)
MDSHQGPPPTPDPGEEPRPTDAQQPPAATGHEAPGFWSAEQPPPWGGPPPPQYGQQQPGQPQYGQPQYGQPGPGQPGQPPYAPPQPWQPQYGQPPYGQLQPGQAPYGQPPYGPDGWGQLAFGQRAPVAPRVVAAPAGEPFHRLGRNAKFRWWRPLAGTALLVALALTLTLVVLIAWEVVHGVVAGKFTAPEGNALFPNTTEDLSAQLVMLGILTPAVLFVVWIVQRRPAWSVASVKNRLRLRWLAICCLPAIGYLALSYALGTAVDAIFPNVDTDTSDSGSWVGLSAFILPAVLIVLLVPFQSAAEEFIFRGWLIQAVGSYGPDSGSNVVKRILRTPWPALVISSAAFVSAHGYTGWAMADIFLFAMTAGWLAVRTGGLEAGIALHTMNNLFAFLLPAAMGKLDGWSNQGGAPWTLLVSDIPCLVFYAFAVVWLAKRQKLETVSG